MLEAGKLKSLLGIEADDTTHDAAIDFILSDVTEMIINYCNIAKLPDGLTHTAYRMAIDLYRNENIGAADSATGAVSSINEGDVSVSFRGYVDEGYKDTLLKDYAAQLNRYRRLVW